MEKNACSLTPCRGTPNPWLCASDPKQKAFHQKATQQRALLPQTASSLWKIKKHQTVALDAGVGEEDEAKEKEGVEEEEAKEKERRDGVEDAVD